LSILFQKIKSQAIKLAPPDSFLRNLAILGSGTAIAQLIPVLSSPILTRLYTPEDFGIFAVFMALISTFIPIICGKYEVALVLPRNNMEAKHLLGIAFYFCFILVCAVGALFLFSEERILLLIHISKLGSWLMAVPMVLFLVGIFTALSYYSNRNKRYKLLANARIIRSVVTALVSISAGYFTVGFGGLLAGFFIGVAVASLFLLTQNREILTPSLIRWSRTKKNLLCKYRHYPIYNASTSLLNGLTLNLPVFFLSGFFPETIVGYYAIVFRVAYAPVGFIATSISQINLKKVVDLISNNSPVIPYLLKLSGLLLLLILVPAFPIIMWGPEIFGFVFGENWSIAGEYARILMPAIIIQFISSTLSGTLEATQHNQLLALWRLISIFSTTSILFLFASYGKIFTFLKAYTINNILLYILYFIFIIFSAHNPKNYEISQKD